MNDNFAEFHSSPGYRFNGSAFEEVEVTNAGTSISVDFYPTYDDFVELSLILNKRNKVRSTTQSTLLLLLLFNLVALPATLLFIDVIIPAFLILAVNLGLAGYLLPAAARFDYRKYYRKLYPNFENDLVSIEANDDGFLSRFQGNVSFQPWKNIIQIQETKDSIFIFSKSTGHVVRKNGFAYDEQKNRFLRFIRERIAAHSKSDHNEIDKPAKKSLDY